MSRRLRRVERAILDVIQRGGAVSEPGLAREVFGVTEPSEAQCVVTRRAVRSLTRKGLLPTAPEAQPVPDAGTRTLGKTAQQATSDEPDAPLYLYGIDDGHRVVCYPIIKGTARSLYYARDGGEQTGGPPSGLASTVLGGPIWVVRTIVCAGSQLVLGVNARPAGGQTPTSRADREELARFGAVRNLGNPGGRWSRYLYAKPPSLQRVEVTKTKPGVDLKAQPDLGLVGRRLALPITYTYSAFAADVEQDMLRARAEVSERRAEMADAHPDRGGSQEAFSAARERYLDAKKAAAWLTPQP